MLQYLYAKHMGKQKAGISNHLFKQAQHVVSASAAENCARSKPTHGPSARLARLARQATGPAARVRAVHASGQVPAQGVARGWGWRAGTRSTPAPHPHPLSLHPLSLPTRPFLPGPATLRPRAQILVREPYGVLQSYSKVLEPTMQELGYTVRGRA
jgi:hypothetical protein